MPAREDLDIPNFIDGPSYRSARYRSSGMDPATKRLAMVAGGIGGVLAVLVGGYALTGGHKGGVPVIEAAAGPIRVKPDNPGGLQVFGDDASLATANEKEGTAPPPEVPDPAALRAQRTAEATPPAPAAAPLPPQTPAAPPTAAAAPVAVAPPPVAPPVVAAAAPASEPVRVTPAAKGGHTEVQLAALGSEQAATEEWGRLAKRFPDLFGGRQPAVTRTEHDGKTFYRLRTGGFADTAEAATFCRQVREKGAACSIASF